MIRPRAGTAEILEPGLRRVLADNPSPMTHWGTNSYIIGSGQVAVIDPGPDDPGHLAALLAALEPGEVISHILVTHSHLDHSASARALSAATGAPVLAHGDASAGQSRIMRALVRAGLQGGGEGVDHAFEPDICLADGQVVAGPDWQLRAIWTPGHIGNHLCLAWRTRMFTGDHVMGWASSLVSPPDGDLSDFMASLHKLAALRATVFYPGHGAPVPDPAARLDWLTRHRLGRESSILKMLKRGDSGVAALTAAIYSDTPRALLPAAERNVLAHLIDLVQTNRVRPVGQLAHDAVFALVRDVAEH